MVAPFHLLAVRKRKKGKSSSFFIIEHLRPTLYPNGYFVKNVYFLCLDKRPIFILIKCGHFFRTGPAHTQHILNTLSSKAHKFSGMRTYFSSINCRKSLVIYVVYWFPYDRLNSYHSNKKEKG